MKAHHKTSTQPYLAIITMTEKHRVQWLRMLAQLQAAQAPSDQLEFCRVQLIRLNGTLYRMWKS